MVRYNELFEQDITAKLKLHFQIVEDKFARNLQIKIDADGIVDIIGVCKLITPLNTLPVKFGSISSSFNLDFAGLTSLEGCPTKVGGSFACRKNKLTSLKGGPIGVNGNYNCMGNKLTSLEGMPDKVGADFSIPYYPDLPLLRLLVYTKGTVYLHPRDESPQYILDQFCGNVSRSNIIQFQKALIQAGFEGNASW